MKPRRIEFNEEVHLQMRENGVYYFSFYIPVYIRDLIEEGGHKRIYRSTHFKNKDSALAKALDFYDTYVRDYVIEYNKQFDKQSNIFEITDDVTIEPVDDVTIEPTDDVIDESKDDDIIDFFKNNNISKPEYPRKKDFREYFVYKRGKVIDEGYNIRTITEKILKSSNVHEDPIEYLKDLMNAGYTVEYAFDKVGFDKAKAFYFKVRKEDYEKIKTYIINKYGVDYPKIDSFVYEKAFIECDSDDYDESDPRYYEKVINLFRNYTKFAQDIISLFFKDMR